MHLSDDVDLKILAKMSEGYTGADLRAVMYAAYRNNDKISKFRQ